MADEQAGTLAFLQNFYTDVTLYMPFEAEERELATPTSSEAAPASTLPAQPVAALAPSVATPAVAPRVPASPVAALVSPVAVPVPPLPPLPPIAAAVPAGKLPSLAGVGLVTPSVAAPPAPAKPAPPASPIPAPTPAPAPVAPYLLTTFATLGDNAQGVVLLVRLPAEQFKKLPRNVFLNNLLKAIGLVMADVVLVNVEGPYPVALQNLRKEIAATHIMAFGKNLLDVAVRTTQIYEPVQFPTVGLAYLAGAEIAMIEYDTSLKKRLWGGLQRMFLS
jgi:hypothetical protein